MWYRWIDWSPSCVFFSRGTWTKTSRPLFYRSSAWDKSLCVKGSSKTKCCLLTQIITSPTAESPAVAPVGAQCVCVCVCVCVCECGCAEIHVFVVRLHFGSQISQSTCYESKWITVYFKIQMCCFTLNRNAANENWIYLKNDIVSNWSVDWFWYNDLHICRNIFHSFNMWKKRRFHTLLLNLLWMQVSVFSCSFIGLYLV